MSLRPRIMAIVNVTPDSFSDGGLCNSEASLRKRLDELAECGVGLVDIGAESTRPGSHYISEQEELERLKFAFECVRRDYPFEWSIDSRRFGIMSRALDCGFSWINNVEGVLPVGELAQLRRQGARHYIAMHMHKSPWDMQNEPLGQREALEEIERFFVTAEQSLKEAGFSEEHYHLDPGLGFGKSNSANLMILAQCRIWSQKWPLAVGLSRKSFLRKIFGIEALGERDQASKILECLASVAGAGVIRTHQVPTLLEALRKIEADV